MLIAFSHYGDQGVWGLKIKNIYKIIEFIGEGPVSECERPVGCIAIENTVAERKQTEAMARLKKHANKKF